MNTPATKNTYADLDAANARIVALERELADCRAQARRMEVRIKKLLAERSFERNVRRARNLSPIVKEVGIMLTQHYEAQDTPDPEPDGTPGYKGVWLPAAAEALGVSPDTVGRAVKTLRDAGAFRYEVRPQRATDGSVINRSFYAPLPAWREHPDRVAEAAPARKHGGARVICPNRECESDRVIIRSHYVCMECGTEWGHRDVDANREDAPDAPTPLPQDAVMGGAPIPEPDIAVAVPAAAAPAAPAAEPEPIPIRPPASPPALTPAWVLEEDWYDPSRPDDGLSQLLAWGLYEDMGQATAWYQAQGLYGPFQRNAAVLTITGRGGLRPVEFVLYLRELYERGDHRQLRQIMRHRGGDADRIRPLLADLGEPVADPMDGPEGVPA